LCCPVVEAGKAADIGELGVAIDNLRALAVCLLEGLDEHPGIAVLFEVGVAAIGVRVGRYVLGDAKLSDDGQGYFNPAMAGVGVNGEGHVVVLLSLSSLL